MSPVSNSSVGVIYQPLEPLRKFEPLKPFEPIKPFELIKPFEPLKPFEPPKSFELAKQIEALKPQSESKQSETDSATQAAPPPAIVITTAEKTASAVAATTAVPATSSTVAVAAPTQFENASLTTEAPTVSNNINSENGDFKPEVTTNTINSFNGLESFGGLPLGYEPVIALEPLDLNALVAPIQSEPITQNKETPLKAEIEEGKAKSTLKEIISEIDSYAERDKDLEPVSNRADVDIKKVR